MNSKLAMLPLRVEEVSKEESDKGVHCCNIVGANNMIYCREIGSLEAEYIVTAVNTFKGEGFRPMGPDINLNLARNLMKNDEIEVELNYYLTKKGLVHAAKKGMLNPKKHQVTTCTITREDFNKYNHLFDISAQGKVSLVVEAGAPWNKSVGFGKIQTFKNLIEFKELQSEALEEYLRTDITEFKGDVISAIAALLVLVGVSIYFW